MNNTWGSTVADVSYGECFVLVLLLKAQGGTVFFVQNVDKTACVKV